MTAASEGGEAVGFIGLGVMGRPMAANLIRAGFEVVVHSRSRGPVDELVAIGGTAAHGVADLVERADVVVTMLPTSTEVTEVLLDPERGALAVCRPGQLIIDMSTIEPAVAQRVSQALEAAGVAFLDAPVSGGETGATSGALSIMVGGRQDAFRRAEPIFAVLGSSAIHVGSAGAGQIAKACNQLVVAATIEAVAEALGLAHRAGLDPAICRRVLLGGFAASRVLEVHGERMLSRDYRPGFRARLHLKDARIVRSLAAGAEAATPAFDIAARHLEELVATGRGELDHSALLEIVDPAPTVAASPG